MADALTSVRAIRAADKVTYIDHFGGDSEGEAGREARERGRRSRSRESDPEARGRIAYA